MKNKMLHVVKDFYIRMKEDDVDAWAAKLTFFTLLSMFPFLIFMMEILNHITLDGGGNYAFLKQFFPPEVIAMFQLILEDIQRAETSSSLLPIAIIGAVWAASKGVLAIIGGLNMAYKEKETRSYLYLRALSLIYTVALAIIIIVTLALIVFGNMIIRFLIENFPALANQDGLFDVIRYLFSIILIFIFFIVLYNVTPNKKITLLSAIPGAIFSTISWLLVSYFFSFYVNTSKSFSYMYGSLTGIIILLLWMYITSTIIMVGGLINAVIAEHRH